MLPLKLVQITPYFELSKWLGGYTADCFYPVVQWFVLSITVIQYSVTTSAGHCKVLLCNQVLRIIRNAVKITSKIINQ